MKKDKCTENIEDIKEGSINTVPVIQDDAEYVKNLISKIQEEKNKNRKIKDAEDENADEDEGLTKSQMRAREKARRREQKLLRRTGRAERRKTHRMAKKGYLPEKTQEQIIEDAIRHMIDENNLFGEARRDIKELIAGDGIDPNHNGYLILNDCGRDIYVMCMYIEKNPRKNEFAGTYETLMNSKGVTTSIHIEPLTDGKASKAMDKRILILDSEQQGAEKDGDRNRYRKLGSKLRDAENYAEEVEVGAKKMFEVSFIFVLHSTDLDQLMLDANEFHNKALNAGIDVCSCFGVHPEAFISAFPTNRLYRAESGLVRTTCVKKHTMDAESLACIFNHTKSDFYHENGIIAGRNMNTGRAATFDPYDRMFDSYGVIVSGATGTGKSATVKMYLTRFTDFNMKIASIDFERVGSRGEYSSACEMSGGQNFVVKVGSDEIINLFEIDTQTEYDESGNTEYEDLLLMDKVSDLVNLLMTMATYSKSKPDYDTEVFYEEIIRKIVIDLFDERGIADHDINSLYETDINGNRVKKQLPTITDFYRKLLLESRRNKSRLKDKAFELLISSMQGFVKYCAYTDDTLKFFTKEEAEQLGRNADGQVVYVDEDGAEHTVEVVVGTRSFFDGQSTIKVDMETPWINIDISQLIEADRPIAEAIAANYLNENFIKKNSANPRKASKRIIMIDECHKMFIYEHLRRFLSDLYRTARKRLISPWLITQALYDFSGYKETESILEQTSTMILLKQDKHTDFIKKTTRMTDAQISMLMGLGGDPLDKTQGNARKGELCMVMKGHPVFIKVDYLEDSEFGIVETDLMKIKEKHEGRRMKDDEDKAS